MTHIKLIDDPIYLSQQRLVPVRENQVVGLLNHIRAMVILCERHGLTGMGAPQAGLHYNFFIAKQPGPRAKDYDTIFEPVVTPVEQEGTVKMEEHGVDGKLYRVERYQKVKMTWKYHNGQTFEDKDGVFEGPVAYIAQRQTERLNGIYLGASDSDEEVDAPVLN